MAQVGTVICTFVKPQPGDPEAFKEQLLTWQRLGMQGEGNQVTGLSPGNWRYVCVYYDVPASVLAWGRAIEDLVGQFVSIVDDWGNTYTGMLIKTCTALRRTPAWDGSGTPRIRGEVRISGTREELE